MTLELIIGKETSVISINIKLEGNINSFSANTKSGILQKENNESVYMATDVFQLTSYTIKEHIITDLENNFYILLLIKHIIIIY